MRFFWLLLTLGGVALAIFANHVGLLALGLLLALVGGFCAVFAFAAARIESSARPDSALLTPDVVAAVRARAAQQAARQQAAARTPNLAPPRPPREPPQS